MHTKKLFLATVFLAATILSISPISLPIPPASATFPGGNGKIAFAGQAPQSYAQTIFSMWPNGASQTQLIPIPPYTCNLYPCKIPESFGNPAWSPDGSRIAFQGVYPPAVGGRGIFTIKADGTDMRQLITDGFSPAWSPDGTKIVFESFVGNRALEIEVMDSIDGHNVMQLTNAGYDAEPSWSPDGSKIAFVSSRTNGPTGIWVMNADGSNQMQLVTLGGTDSWSPDWSPDGSKIIFWTDNSGIWVWNFNLNGLNQLRQTGMYPSWSPDGTKIVYNSALDGGILFMTADGTGLATQFPAVGLEPNWQPSPQAFYVSVAAPSIYLQPGSSSSTEILVSSIGGFNSAVSLSASWIGTPPVGVDFYIPGPAIVAPSTSTGNATWPLTITASTDAVAGNYTLEITGTSSYPTTTASFNYTTVSDVIVHIQYSATVSTVSSTTTTTSAPDFYMFPCCFPDVLPVAQGGSSSASINMNSVNSFSGAVTLTSFWVGTAPADTVVYFNQHELSLGRELGASHFVNATITAAYTAPPGSYLLRVIGTSGSLAHVVDIPVQITGPTPTAITSTTGSTSTAVPDFSISTSSPQGEAGLFELSVGDNRTIPFTVTSSNGFNSTVALSWSWLGTPPARVYPVWNANPKCFLYPEGWLCPELRVTADLNATVGNFPLRITGTSGSLSHSVDVSIVVIPLSTSTAVATTATSTTAATPPSQPKCLIATATYGSELAPEVQLLRNFRDNSILRTEAGSAFMVAFNAWYYSFSPYVASYLSTHWVERTIMKGALYPLIGILALTSASFTAASGYPELAALLSGLVASSLIGAFYLGLPLGLLGARSRRLRALRSSGPLGKLLCIFLLSGIALLLAGEGLASPISLITASATVVLSTMFLSAAFISSTITNGLRE